MGVAKYLLDILIQLMKHGTNTLHVAFIFLFSVYCLSAGSASLVPKVVYCAMSKSNALLLILLSASPLFLSSLPRYGNSVHRQHDDLFAYLWLPTRKKVQNIQEMPTNIVESPVSPTKPLKDWGVQNKQTPCCPFCVFQHLAESPVVLAVCQLPK